MRRRYRLISQISPVKITVPVHFSFAALGAVRPSSRQAGVDAGDNHLAFELGEDAEHLENRAPARVVVSRASTAHGTPIGRAKHCKARHPRVGRGCLVERLAA